MRRFALPEQKENNMTGQTGSDMQIVIKALKHFYKSGFLKHENLTELIGRVVQSNISKVNLIQTEKVETKSAINILRAQFKRTRLKNAKRVKERKIIS